MKWKTVKKMKGGRIEALVWRQPGEPKWHQDKHLSYVAYDLNGQPVASFVSAFDVWPIDMLPVLREAARLTFIRMDGQMPAMFNLNTAAQRGFDVEAITRATREYLSNKFRFGTRAEAEKVPTLARQFIQSMRATCALGTDIRKGEETEWLCFIRIAAFWETAETPGGRKIPLAVRRAYR